MRTAYVDKALTHDRWFIAAALALIVAIAWGYLLTGPGTGMNVLDMTTMPRDMPMERSMWTVGYAAVMFSMWWIMMIAMMLPSAAPILLLVAALNRTAGTDGRPYGAAGFFAAGYLGAWALFSALAVAAQWWMTYAGLLSGMMHVESQRVAGALLIAAGLWQLTPIKRVCLTRCRSPVQFLTERRRKGNLGAVAMGAEHGIFCLGCCWLLMSLLFVGGVMNLYWIAGLAVFVLAEKVLPAGARFGRWAGLGFVVWGIVVIGNAVE